MTHRPGTNLAHFYDILSRVYTEGVESSPRGQRTRELLNFHYTLPPRVRFCSFAARGLKMDYVKQEFLWYLRGDARDISIRKIAKMWDGLIQRDGTINSNYGQYIFAHDEGGISNFGRAAGTLIEDPDSRRAVIMILGNHHLNQPESKDYPCTAYLNFHIRQGKLIMHVRMRSQDAIFGMGNDAPTFSFTHELMWSVLRDHYPGLQLGEYHHTSDSMHIYERHFDMVESIIRSPVWDMDENANCPEMDPGMDQMLELHTIAHSKYSQQPFESGKYEMKLSPFTEWLLTRDDPNTLLPVEYVA